MFTRCFLLPALLFLYLIGANDVFGHKHGQGHHRIPAVKRAANIVSASISSSATTAASTSIHNIFSITTRSTQTGLSSTITKASTSIHENSSITSQSTEINLSSTITTASSSIHHISSITSQSIKTTTRSALSSIPSADHEAVGDITTGARSNRSAIRIEVESARKLGPFNVTEECVLWNSACKGNKTLATERFFGDLLPRLLEDDCFVHQGEKCTNGSSAKNPWQFEEIKKFMRSSECGASLAKYDGRHNLTKWTIENGHNCCGQCMIEAQNVFIHYWPEANANESCKSIVGDGIPFGLYHGATTNANGQAYWGCTSGSETITTAQITTLGMGPLSVKETIVDPWGPQPCTEAPSADPSELSTSFYADVVPLSIQQSITESAQLPVSTVVYRNYTFTSPYIYARFKQIAAGDLCGKRSIYETMLSFTPGELSTIAGPLYNPSYSGLGDPNWATQPFNIGDLPCPPQSIMEQNWYRPKFREPYRPLIAMPKQIIDLDPFFSSCTDGFFTGYDPPRSLVAAQGLAAATTTVYTPVAEVATAAPSSVQGSQPKETGVAKTGGTSGSNQPADTGSSSQQDGSESGTQSDDPENTDSESTQSDSGTQSSDPENTNSDSSQQSASQDSGNDVENQDSNSASGQETNSNPSNNAESDNVASEQDENTINSNQQKSNDVLQAQDLSNLTPNEMAQLKNALGSTSTNSQDSSSNNPSNPSETTISLAGHTLTISPSGIYVDGSTTPISSSSTTISLANGKSIAIGTDGSISISGSASSPLTKIGGHAIFAASSQLSVHTPTPQAIEASQIAAQASEAGAETSQAAIAAGESPAQAAAASVSASQAAVAAASSAQASEAGAEAYQAAIAAGESPAQAAAASVLASQAAAAAMGLSPTAAQSQPFVTAIDGQAITAAPQSIVFAGSTLYPGGAAATINGVVVSLAANGEMVIGGKTIDLDNQSTRSANSAAVTSSTGASATSSKNANAAMSITGAQMDSLSTGRVSTVSSGTAHKSEAGRCRREMGIWWVLGMFGFVIPMISFL